MGTACVEDLVRGTHLSTCMSVFMLIDLSDAVVVSLGRRV
jgi:hypothetical protein